MYDEVIIPTIFPIFRLLDNRTSDGKITSNSDDRLSLPHLTSYHRFTLTMPLIKVNYKSLYYKDWRPENGSHPRATLIMVSIVNQITSEIY
jgi:hypothetical protein